jgi:hypothetical protein
MDSAELKWVIPHAASDGASSEDYSAFDHSVKE